MTEEWRLRRRALNRTWRTMRDELYALGQIVFVLCAAGAVVGFAAAVTTWTYGVVGGLLS